MMIKKSKPDSENLSQLSKKKIAIFSLIPAAIFFISLEIVLRVGGFYFSTTPLFVGVPEIVVKGNNSVEIQKRNGFNGIFRKDRWLLWILKPNNESVNSEGFRGREISVNKPKNTLRIACMGDSCTMMGEIPYPEYIESMLKERINGLNIEVINAGCSSYSSLQGLRSLDMKVHKYKPDFISIFFGWNDHWLSLGKEDKEIEVKTDYLIAFKNLMNHLRTYQFAVMQILYLKKIITADGIWIYPLKPRVSLKDYEDNLNKMIEICREIQATPILMTAPTILDANSEALQFLCKNGLFSNPNLFNKVHSQYNDIVRKVALEKGGILLDLEIKMDQLNDKSNYFLKDGIHFTKQGRVLVGQLLSETISSKWLKEYY